MDPREILEIYIPVEAEVKNIPLWSLPNSVLRRMGLALSDSKGSRKLKGSPEGIWISPAVIRRKGQKLAPHTGSSVLENMSSLLGREFQAATGSFHMSFVSSNRRAYKVLKDITPEKKVSAYRSHSSLLPQGLAPRTYQTAIVIYHGCIYLSIRKPNRSQSQQVARDPQSAAWCSRPTTSLTKSQKKSHTVDSQSHRDARGEQVAEEAAAPEPEGFQPEGVQEVVANKDSGECERQDLGGEEAERTRQNNDMDADMQMDSGEVNHSSNQSCTRRESLGAACASTSLVKEFDFKELAQEEMIAEMKARLRYNEAALNNFPPL